MPDPNLALQPGTVSSQKTSARFLHMLIALVLSVPFPGLGHLYAGRANAGLFLGLLYFVGAFVQGALHAMKTPKGLAFFILWNVGGGLFIVVHAARAGWTRKAGKDASGRSKIALFGEVALLIAFAVLRSTDWFADRYVRRKAFNVSSQSMCPTICEGERMIVDPQAYKAELPKRGDIVLFQYQPDRGPYVKRVIGIPGDIVERGPANSILVNGAAVGSPTTCGNPPRGSEQSEPIDFPKTRVPDGALFVIGDNLGNSFDSRISSFGFAKPEKILGKPLFLYWSPYQDRIGCLTR